MKRRVICLLTIFILIISCNFPTAIAQETEQKDTVVLPARLENMLNHNRLFGDDFNNVNAVVDNSIIALLDKREEDFIKEDIIKGFVQNMYDLSIDGYTAFPQAPTKEGYIFILPRGYDSFSHEIKSIEKNGALYCVISQVSFNTHDGQEQKANCETVFLENENSAFGYNIISAKLS